MGATPKYSLDWRTVRVVAPVVKLLVSEIYTFLLFETPF